MQKTNPYRIASVDRALVILSILGAGEAVSVTRAQKELGVAPSTAHRILSTLVGRGFAVQAKDRMYYAGPNLINPGRHHGRTPIRTLLRPTLEQLFRSIEETVHLAVLRYDSTITFVDGIEGKQHSRVALRIGQQLPALQSSGGKAISQMRHAGSPDDRVFISASDAYFDAPVKAISAAIGTYDSESYALTVTIPAERMTRDRQKRLAKELAWAVAAARRALTSKGY
ncbi:MAG: helix-turn-helix domain-containing protein [Actinomycetaceae bacterium]|nr:helix-turn-helix domain-containing protein [Arcanobacterium sp.]MDD7504888.1 helix-turn-helix domain-containing protein [Actinomycetaceae bacterium]MDY6142724.1 helix-turn-helix domain-containing protein [Arcanobacterium sp.]